jgi:hypothetical protein
MSGKLTAKQVAALEALSTARFGELRQSTLRAMHGVDLRTLSALYERDMVTCWGNANGPSWEITSAGRALLSEEKANG